MKRIDLTGKRFGRLIVCGYDKTVNGHAYWVCICSCGLLTSRNGTRMKSGGVRSCGCLQAETSSTQRALGPAARRTHGMYKSPEYRSWQAMKARCLNPNNKRYHDYGGRGIRICNRWKHSFIAFFQDMGVKPSSSHTIDRRNNDGNYEPSNCYWATVAQQASHKRVRKDHNR